MNLLDLPVEILLHIESFLPVDDVLTLSLVCRKLNDTTYNEENWRLFCRRDYDIKLRSNSAYSARDLYVKLLRKYGCLIGLWQTTVKHYGGLVRIQLIDGALVAEEIYAPYFSGWKDPLKCKQIFTIDFDATGERVRVLTNTGQEGGIRFLKGKDSFNFRLNNTEKPARDLRKQEEEFQEWLKEQGYGPGIPGYPSDNPAGLLSKFLVFKNYKLSCSFKRIIWPAANFGFPIQPGLFRSDYDEHGPELIMLTYEEEEPKATAIKITGDPNIPAGKVTFFSNLNYPLHEITFEEQENFNTLSSVKAEKVPYTTEGFLNVPPQVFRVPGDIDELFAEILPEISIGRFQGHCQLAYHGYKDPTFSKGHWVIFDHDTFGFIFLEVFSISMYYRVEEPRLY